MAAQTFLDNGFRVFLEIIKKLVIHRAFQAVQPALQALGKAMNGRKGIIDFMRNACRQHAHGGHFLSLVKLGLELFFHGDIALEQKHPPLPGSTGFQR